MPRKKARPQARKYRRRAQKAKAETAAKKRGWNDSRLTVGLGLVAEAVLMRRIFGRKR